LADLWRCQFALAERLISSTCNADNDCWEQWTQEKT